MKFLTREFFKGQLDYPRPFKPTGSKEFAGKKALHRGGGACTYFFKLKVMVFELFKLASKDSQDSQCHSWIRMD